MVILIKPLFRETAVPNGTIHTWNISAWGVKEKFEYDIKVVDNGQTHHYNNRNKENLIRYNFEAKPYRRFGPNGGQRHHFIPAKSLRENGFNSDMAYCIRMMTEDHRKTGSYGSSAYVRDTTNLLRERKYREALQKEVRDLQSSYDCDRVGTLEQKYYDQVFTCLYEYERLFGVY